MKLIWVPNLRRDPLFADPCVIFADSCVKFLFRKVMQLCEPFFAAWTSRI